MADITRTEVETVTREPEAASAGGRSATNRDPEQMLTVKRKLDADTAVGADTMGLVFNRFKPGDAVN